MTSPTRKTLTPTRTRSARTCAGLAVCAVLAACFDWTRDPAGRPEYLVDYIRAHFRDLGEEFRPPWSRDEFRQRLQNVRVLYLGDHHRDAGLHGEILDLLTWLSNEGFRPVLGLEAIGTQDHATVQAYLAGDVEQQEMRRRIQERWPGSWLDHESVDREFYRGLLATARERNVPVFGLEPTPRLPLGKRDARIAGSIKRALRLHPARLVVVVVGHAHLLGDGHLVGRVGAPALTIGARLSPELKEKLSEHPPVPRSGFLRTETGVLFFGRTRER